MFHFSPLFDFCINIWYNTAKDHVTGSTELSVSVTHLVGKYVIIIFVIFVLILFASTLKV